MKSKIILAVLLLSSVQGFAQSSRTAAVGELQSAARGFTMGLVYSNLTDAKSKSETNVYIGGVRSGGYSETDSGGTHAGLYGLNLGFKDLYAFGVWGWDGGVQVLKGLNGSETPQQMTVFKMYGDVAWPVTDMFALVGGLNLSYFDQLITGSGVKEDPGVGAQIGVETRIHNLSLLLGVQAVSATFKGEGSGVTEDGVSYKGDSKSEFNLGGFLAQVDYTF